MHTTFIYSILQFYNSTILQENTHHQKNSNFIDCYLHIFNSTILQEKTRHQKNSNFIDCYLHIFNSTILPFYGSTGKHVTKKTQTSLTATYIYSILQFNNSTILQENTRHQKNSNFIDCYLPIQFYKPTILQFYRKKHVTKKTQTLCFKININITCTHIYICSIINYNIIICRTVQFYNSTNSTCRKAHISGGWSGVVSFQVRYFGI